MTQQGERRSERLQGPLCWVQGRKSGAPGRSSRAGPGGETQGRSGRGGGQLLAEQANKGLIKERVLVVGELGRAEASESPLLHP